MVIVGRKADGRADVSGNKPVRKAQEGRVPVRSPLGNGAHFEVEVRHAALKWKGIIDLLDIREDSCSIKDFKTGEASADHVLQIKVYALLWLRDQQINPNARPASRLAISYPAGEEEIIVSPNELNELATSLRSRTERVRVAVSGAGSPAKISHENCSGCDVRHLCSEYWDPLRRRDALATNAAPPSTDDIQLILRTKKGERTWLAECQVSNRFGSKTMLLMRWSPTHSSCFESAKPGTIVRMSGAVASTDDDSHCGVVDSVNSADVLLLDN